MEPIRFELEARSVALGAPVFRLLAALIVLLTPICAAAQIGIYFDTTAYTHDACVTPTIPLRSYIAASPWIVGMQGAEFRVTGFGSNWSNTVIPNPIADYLIGNPLVEGCQIAFPYCQSDALVILFTVDTVVSEAIPETTLQVLAHTTPSNPSFACPLTVMCDAPTWTKVCAWGGEAHLTSCTTAVSPATWTSLRALYR